jgi:hypothetical protein
MTTMRSAVDELLDRLRVHRRTVEMYDQSVVRHERAVVSGNKIEIQRTKDAPRMLQKARHKNGESNVQEVG